MQAFGRLFVAILVLLDLGVVQVNLIVPSRCRTWDARDAVTEGVVCDPAWPAEKPRDLPVFGAISGAFTIGAPGDRLISQ